VLKELWREEVECRRRVIVIVVVLELVHVHGMDAGGARLRSTPTKLLQKGNRVSTQTTKPSGKPSSGTLLPGITAITVSDPSSCPPPFHQLIQRLAVDMQSWLSSCSILGLLPICNRVLGCLRLLPTDKTTSRLPGLHLPICLHHSVIRTTLTASSSSPNLPI
jgi:hypothetical protein